MITNPEGCQWQVICLSGVYFYKQVDGVIFSWRTSGNGGWIETGYKSPEDCAARLRGKLVHVANKTPLELVEQQIDRAERLKNHYILMGNMRALSWVNVRLSRFRLHRATLLQEINAEKQVKIKQINAEKQLKLQEFAEKARQERLQKHREHNQKAQELAQERWEIRRYAIDLRDRERERVFTDVMRERMNQADWLDTWLEVDRRLLKAGDYVVWTVPDSVDVVFKIDQITSQGTVLFDGGQCTLNQIRPATKKEIKAYRRLKV